jgi:hypothetical protein
MAQPLRVSRSVTVPVEPAFAFARVLDLDLAAAYRRRFAAVPPIRSVEGQDGPWGRVGQTRLVRLADGGSMREELLSVDAPHEFAYAMTDIKGPLAPLATRVEGRWTIEPAGTGCRVSWAWTVHPRGVLGAAGLPAFGRMWLGYARQALEEISATLVAAHERSGAHGSGAHGAERP